MGRGLRLVGLTRCDRGKRREDLGARQGLGEDGGGLAGLKENVEGNPGAPVFTEFVGDDRIFLRPVSLEHHHARLVERLGHIILRVDALVDLAGGAPARGEVDVDNLAVGESLRLHLRRPGLPIARGLGRCAWCGRLLSGCCAQHGLDVDESTVGRPCGKDQVSSIKLLRRVGQFDDNGISDQLLFGRGRG